MCTKPRTKARGAGEDGYNGPYRSNSKGHRRSQESDEGVKGRLMELGIDAPRLPIFEMKDDALGID